MNENTYSTSKNQSLRDKAALSTRTKIYGIISEKIPIDDLKSIIDVGVTADKEQEASNFFEKLYPYPDRITALSDQDASWMEDAYKGLKFVRGNALNMPFKDNTFDLVFSSAVIEHVGSRKNQKKFIQECIRISKKYVYITTPNRWYPVELHTALPLLHWLPPKLHRAVLTSIGKEFFASEENLNLLSKNELERLLPESARLHFSIGYAKFLGMRSNLLLKIEKQR